MNAGHGKKKRGNSLGIEKNSESNRNRKGKNQNLGIGKKKVKGEPVPASSLQPLPHPIVCHVYYIPSTQ